MHIDITKTSKPKARIPDAELGFGKAFTDHMLLVDFARERGWHSPRVVPYGPIALDPAAAVFHYGQAMFEGLKVFRGADDKLRMFRLDRHAARLNASATQLCMPHLPPELFMESLKALVRADADWVPRAPGTSLYVRPTMVATEPFLGVRAADAYQYFVILSPVGSYYGGGGLSPVRIWVEKQHVRVAPGGLGAAKAGANYVASLFAATEAKKKGWAQVLWLDPVEHEWIEEVGTMNLFVRIGDELITPPLDGSILAGVTRDCVLTLAREWGLKTTERPISVTELIKASANGSLQEVFGCGTAAVISPVGELGIGEQRITVGGGKVGELASRLHATITGIQTGTVKDTHGWLTEV